MKKLFPAICFSLMFPFFSVLAATTELSSVDELRAREAQAPKDAEPITDPRIPTGEDKEEMEEFIKERLKTVVITKLDENEDLNNLKSIDVQHSAEYINMLKESKKSTFEKIYDNAMKRLSGPEGRTPEDINEPYDDVYYYINDQPSVEEQKKEWAAPDFPVVNVELPNGTQTLVPAKEHIPYLFSKIEILPTGLIGINETITVIANGDKLKNGLSRAIPKYSTSRAGIRNKVDLTLLSVTVNGQEVPYKAEEAGDKIILTPKEEYTLAPGIYTYNFAYLLDRQLWYYDTFNEFYWDVTGSSWNLVVANAGASVSLPGTQPPLSQNILLGYPGQLTTDGAFIAKGEDNTLGFAAQTPLFVGEGMHIIVSLPKTDLLPPDLGKRFSWFIADYGDILFALAGLAAILVSYIISWKYISAGRSKLKTGMRRTAPMLRYLIKGAFDKVSFVSYLLELFRKNIIDIQESDGEVMLIKKTDDLKSLERRERKAVGHLFPGKESVVRADAQNLLKFKRAFKLIEKNTLSRFKSLSLKLSAGYLFFSIGMLLLAEAAIASLSVSFGQIFAVELAGSVTLAFYVWLLKLKFRSAPLGWISKTFALLIIVFTLMVLSIYIHPVSALLLLTMIYVIFAYTGIFAKRSGLMKNNIKDALTFRDYLIDNAATLSLGRDFAAQQANIFALDISGKYPETPNIRDAYRLGTAAKLVHKL